MLAGLDGIYGYQELPRVPWIEGDISAMPGMYLETLESQVNVNVVAQLANGMQYTLTSATCKSGLKRTRVTAR